MSPDLPQPKHLKMPLSGTTKKLGVRSWWKGQQALYSLPARVSSTNWPTIPTMSAAALTSSTLDGGITAGDSQLVVWAWLSAWAELLWVSGLRAWAGLR